MNKNLFTKLKNIPEEPGCYIYYNSKKTVIYVGKAKNLFKRVNSYFERFQSVKTDELVKNIDNFDFIVTNTEKESLLLEINLIQKHKPKYNILLKDGRNYPFIRITNEQHPKIDYVLNKHDDALSGTYYGPFPDAKTARGLVDILNKTFKFRKCKTLPKRKCIYYDMNLCYGPCINLVASNIYDQELKLIKDFFSAKPSRLINYLKKEMEEHANNLNFEKAMEFRESLKFIDEFIARQIVEIKDKSDFDIIALDYTHSTVGMYTLMIRGGMILAHDFISNSENEIEEYIINRYANEKTRFYVDKLNIFKRLEPVLPNIKIAKQGVFTELITLAYKNLQIQLDKELLEITKQNQIEKFFNNTLNISKFNNIFMLDISHLGGNYNVGGLVCFSNNIKNKKLYRHYKLSFEFNNDVNSINEIMIRICANENLVQNIDVMIIDGGIIQKNIVEKVFNSYNLNIPVLALEKNAKHTTHELLFEDQIFELTNPILLRYFARIQDEVHRFANTYMHKVSNKKITQSVFSAIKGVGPKRQQILEANFNSIDELVGASIDELEKLGFSQNLAIAVLEAAGELM